MPFDIFDGHCDTVSMLNDTNQSMFRNTCHVDIEKMSKNRHVQVFAAFVDARNSLLSPFNRCCQLINCYHNEIKNNLDYIKHCTNLADIQLALKEGKIAALLSIEGGEAIEGNFKNLVHFYECGVRMMTLCWNYKNEICCGVDSVTDDGLSEFGKDVVAEMNKLGMIVDVSHMSEKSFWDVIEVSKLPVAASHSNVFSLCNHKRNLKDEQIIAIIKSNGVIGINFYSEFLTKERCNISSVLNHIEYILSLGGENNIGLGSDFDGMNSLPEEVNSIRDIDKLPEEMLRIGYKEEHVEKILCKNFLRLIEKNFR